MQSPMSANHVGLLLSRVKVVAHPYLYVVVIVSELAYQKVSWWDVWYVIGWRGTVALPTNCEGTNDDAEQGKPVWTAMCDVGGPLSP